jgi:zinc resistance-associated protein
MTGIPTFPHSHIPTFPHSRITALPKFNLADTAVRLIWPNLAPILAASIQMEADMWKGVLAGATALVIAGSSVVYAQQRMGGPEHSRLPSSQQWQPSQQDIAAFAAARIAALKAGLMLTPEQEQNWPAFETALKDLSRYRMERRAARQDEQPATDPTARLRRRADALSGYGAALAKLADAQEPLYNSLDEAQKRRFAILAQPMRHGRGWRHHGMWQGHGWGHHGMGQRRGMWQGMREPAGGPAGHGWRRDNQHNENGRGDAEPEWRGGQDSDSERGQDRDDDGSGQGRPDGAGGSERL